MAYRSAGHLLALVFAKSHSAQLESLYGLSMSLVCVSLEDALDGELENWMVIEVIECDMMMGVPIHPIHLSHEAPSDVDASGKGRKFHVKRAKNSGHFKKPLVT